MAGGDPNSGHPNCGTTGCSTGGCAPVLSTYGGEPDIPNLGFGLRIDNMPEGVPFPPETPLALLWIDIGPLNLLSTSFGPCGAQWLLPTTSLMSSISMDTSSPGVIGTPCDGWMEFSLTLGNPLNQFKGATISAQAYVISVAAPAGGLTNGIQFPLL